MNVIRYPQVELVRPTDTLGKKDHQLLAQGAANIHDILAVEGIDAVFVGRGDLTVATADRDPAAPHTHAATEAVIRATRAACKPACLFVSGADEARTFIAPGATAFIVSSDPGLLRTAARHALGAFDGWRRG